MIIDTMEWKDIANDLNKSYHAALSGALRRLNSFVVDIRKIPASKFTPKLREHEFRAPGTKTPITFIAYADKAENRRTPDILITSKFFYKKKPYYAELESDRAYLYTDHFVQRYKERVMKDSEADGIDVIMHIRDDCLADRSMRFIKKVSEEDVKAVPKLADHITRDGNGEITSFIEVHRDFVIFQDTVHSDKDYDLFRLKTVLTKEMLFKEQKDTFGKHKDYIDKLFDKYKVALDKDKADEKREYKRLCSGDNISKMLGKKGKKF